MTMEDMPVSVSVLEPLLPDEETAPLITKSQPVVEKKSIWKRAGSLLLYPIKAGYSSGVVCLIFAQLQYAILGYLFKILVDDGMPEFQILFARSLSNTLFSLGMGLLTIHRSRLLLEKGIWFLSAMQGIFGNLGMTTFYISFTLMAEGDAMALTKLSPIFAAVLGWILGWDSLTIQIALGVLVCSGGGVIIEHPPFLFGGESQGSSQLLGALVALSSALFQALLFMATGRVGSRADTITLMLWYHFAGIFMNIVPLAAGIPDGPVFGVTWQNWVLLLVFCILSFTSVFLNFRGIQLCNATLGTSLQTSAVIFAYMLGYYLLGEKITLFAIAGTVGIFLGIVIIAYGKERLRKAKEAQTKAEEAQTKAGDIEA